VSDALNRNTSFAYDVMGRVTSQSLPDGRSIAYSYDNLGNLLSITPPGRNAHVFNYTAVSLEKLLIRRQPLQAQEPRAINTTLLGS